MTPVANRDQQGLSGLRGMPAIPALFRPGLNGVPVLSKIRVFASVFEQRVSKTRDLDQFPQVVRITRIHLPLVWEFVPLSSLCDAGLERAFYCVAAR